MKRLAIALIGLCLLATGANSFWQSRQQVSVGSAPSGCADSNVVAWKAAVLTAGGTVSTGQETNICTLVGSLKTHSLFSIQDRIWLHASENSQQATIDIVNLGVATPVASPTFTANQGYAGDGSTSYLDTNYSTFTNAVNLTQNSGSFTQYIRTNRTVSGGATLGWYDGLSSGTGAIFLPLTFSNVAFAVNAGGFPQYLNVAATALGVWTASRTGPSTTDLYRNSSSTSLGTDATASGSLPTFALNFYIDARNSNASGSSVADNFSNDQIAITTIGGGMTNVQAAQFQTDLNAYMTALGSNVY